jgi:hypothetical protein
MSILFGLMMIPFVVLMNSYSPPKEKIPQGYGSSILAFEFASNPGELDEVLKPLTTEEIKGLDRLNYIDFGFMILYGLFLFSFMKKLGDIYPDKLLNYAKWIPPIAVIADVIENMQLLSLSGSFADNGTYADSAISLLAVFTWTKWLGLALAFAFIGYKLLDLGKYSKALGYLLLIPIGFGIGSCINGARWAEEIFATSVFASFLAVFIYAILYRSSQRATA